MEKNVNRHHTWWEARHYKKNSILTRLRNHHGFIIPMNLFDHRELHHDLLQPPRPSKEEAEELLYRVGHYDSQSERTDYLDIAIGFFQENTPNARMAQHLAAQRSYILLTPFTRIEREIVEFERAMQEANQFGVPLL